MKGSRTCDMTLMTAKPLTGYQTKTTSELGDLEKGGGNAPLIKRRDPLFSK